MPWDSIDRTYRIIFMGLCIKCAHQKYVSASESRGYGHRIVVGKVYCGPVWETIMVRPRVVWMTPADDSILEVLSEIGPHAATPVTLAHSIDYSHSYLARRCRALAEHELVANPDGTLFVITDRGQAYLDGELSREELEE